MNFDLDALFTDPELRASRRTLLERWRSEGSLTDETLPAALDRAAATDPELSITFHSKQRPGRLTMSALAARARFVAGALVARGLRPGDVVAIQLPNWEETAVAYLAVAMTGAVFVPIVHIYGPHETDWILQASGARMFISPDRWTTIDYLERIERMPAAREIELVIVGDERPDGAVDWRDLEAGGATAALPDLCAEDPLLVVYTSGTTADPKGVIHSHQTFLAEQHNLVWNKPGEPFRTCLQPWPAGHIAGLCAIFSPLTTGRQMILVDRWDVGEVARLIEEHDVDRVCAAPIHITALLDGLAAGDWHLASLRTLVSGGAGVPPSLVERADAAGWRMVRSYGSSEHPTATGGNFVDSLPARAHTDGPAMPHSEIRLVDDAGEDAPVGVAGEVWLRGPEQFLGYADPAHNADAFAPGGWFRSGDVGVFDADGRLTITDRIKDIIIRGGENISSLEVEDLLERHPAVAEAAAVGMADDRLGERVCAFVVPAKGAAAPDVASLVAHFDALGAARQKTPERVVEMAELPRTPAGKVKKHELRKQLEG